MSVILTLANLKNEYTTNMEMQDAVQISSRGYSQAKSADIYV